jgi:hypothetical protein
VILRRPPGAEVAAVVVEAQNFAPVLTTSGPKEYAGGCKINVRERQENSSPIYPHEIARSQKEK